MGSYRQLDWKERGQIEILRVAVIIDDTTFFNESVVTQTVDDLCKNFRSNCPALQWPEKKKKLGPS